MSEKMNRQGRAIGKQKRRERGQSLVETAVVLPILLLLVAAIVDFGRAFDAYIILTNAAREGARFGSVNPELTKRRSNSSSSTMSSARGPISRR